MKTIVLSPPQLQRGEATTVTRLFESGLELYHLRKPGVSPRKLKHFISKIPRQYWNRIVLHNNYALARKLGLRGIHITSRIRKKKFRFWRIMRWIPLRYPEVQISTSFHNLNQLYNADRRFHYVFISPVYDSISKGGYQSGFSEYSLKAAIEQSRYNVIALGGIDASKIENLREIGFHGIALMGSIWESDNPVESFLGIQERIKQRDLFSSQGGDMLNVKKIKPHV